MSSGVEMTRTFSTWGSQLTLLYTSIYTTNWPPRKPFQKVPLTTETACSSTYRYCFLWTCPISCTVPKSNIHIKKEKERDDIIDCHFRPIMSIYKISWDLCMGNSYKF